MSVEDKTSCRGYQVTQSYVCGYVRMYYKTYIGMELQVAYMY